MFSKKLIHSRNLDLYKKKNIIIGAKKKVLFYLTLFSINQLQLQI